MLPLHRFNFLIKVTKAGLQALLVGMSGGLWGCFFFPLSLSSVILKLHSNSFSLCSGQEGVWCHRAVSKSTAGEASGDQQHCCHQLTWQVPREVWVAIRHMTVALAMFWKQELVWLAVRASALPAVRAGHRECWIHCLGLCPAEKPAIPRKKSYKQQENAKEKGPWRDQS